MKTYISNAFSLNMLSDSDAAVDLLITPMTPEEVKLGVDAGLTDGTLVVSMQEQTSDVVNSICGTSLTPGKEIVSLQYGDSMIVAQYNGPRLSGGGAIPEGGNLRFFVIDVVDPSL